MNLVIYNRGKICFSHSLYFNSRPPDHFPESHWMTPWGLLMPIGSPATAMRNFIFNSDQLPDEKSANCHTGVLIEPDGRVCTIEFEQSFGKPVTIFKDYRNVENDNTWVVCSDYTVNQSLSMLNSIIDDPLEALRKLSKLHEFNPEGYMQFELADLVETVKTTVSQFKEKSDAPE